MNGHDIVGWAEDLDVSGSVDPFDTPALGPWLTERAGEWDLLVAWKLDRLGRRAIPLNKLFGWTLENEKTLVCVSDNIDLSTWVGRLVANVIAGVAEGELEAIKERTRAGRRKVLESGRWPGGQVPYGLRTAAAPGGGWRLEIEPEQAEVVGRIVDEICQGSAIEAVTDRLNDDQIPAPKGGNWLPSTVWKMIASPHLLGHATYEGRTVRDREGQPVCNADPLLTPERWDELQTAVEGRRRDSYRTRDTSPLAGVVFCGRCELPLFHKRYHRDYGERLYRYYHCRDKSHNQQIRAEQVEELLEEMFLDLHGDQPVRKRVFRPAESHKVALEAAVSAVDELSELMSTVTSPTMRARLTEQLRALDVEIGRLEKLPTRDSGWEWEQTDETFRTRWQASDQDQRRQMLIEAGIRFELIQANPIVANIKTP